MKKRILRVLAALCLFFFFGNGFMAGAETVTTSFGTEPVRRGDVCFNEIMTRNLSCYMLEDGSWPDWIELKNTSDRDVALRGWSIMRADRPEDVYLIGNVTVPAGGVCLLLCDGTGGSRAPFRLSSGGERLLLRDPSGTIVDCAAVPALEADAAWARDAGGEWSIVTGGTPGEENTAQSASGGGQTDVAEGAVILTEVVTANKSILQCAGVETADYVEITNRSSGAVSLAGWHLSDTSARRTKWTFPNVTLPAGGHLVVSCTGASSDAAGAPCASFRLSRDGTVCILSRPDGSIASLVNVPPQENDQAYSFLDGSWTADFPPSPGCDNTPEGVAQAESATLAVNLERVFISEVLASPSADGESDWIELYNASNVQIDLSDYGLSDNSGKMRKWQFPSGASIPAGGYLTVFCDGADSVRSGAFHTSYALSANGGYSIALARPDGTVLDRAYVPPQLQGVSYGRNASGGLWNYFETPTPGTRNPADGYTGLTTAPECSEDGGLFRTGDVRTVTLSALPGAVIRYTVDASDPDETSQVYTGPVQIGGTTVFRARAWQEGRLPSRVVTRSFLYDIHAPDGAIRVVALTSDPTNLFSDETGIMVEGAHNNLMQDWEREGYVEVFEGDGRTLLSDACGVGLHGADSRKKDQKGFNITARARYGASRFDAALIRNRPYTSYQSFMLHAGGEDSNRSLMREVVLTSLARDTSVMYAESEPCLLYLNGAYWGLYNIRERINASSVCQFEGWEGQEEEIDLVYGNRTPLRGSNQSYQELLDWVIATDPNAPGFYEHVSQVIDIENYIEYHSIQIFTGNTDTLNVRRYRNSRADGLWRWCLYDLDWAFTTDVDSISKWLTPGGVGAGKRTDNTLFIALMQNATFRDQFLSHMGRELATTFSAESVVALIEARREQVEPYIDDQLTRWNMSRRNYDKEIERLKEYARTRPSKLLGYFSGSGGAESAIALSGAEMSRYFADALALISESGA